MFPKKYDYRPRKMEYGHQRKLLDACMFGDLDRIKTVIRDREKETGYRVNINNIKDEDFWGCTCLHRAAENGHYEVLVYLMSNLIFFYFTLLILLLFYGVVVVIIIVHLAFFLQFAFCLALVLIEYFVWVYFEYIVFIILLICFLFIEMCVTSCKKSCFFLFIYIH